MKSITIVLDIPENLDHLPEAIAWEVVQRAIDDRMAVAGTVEPDRSA